MGEATLVTESALVTAMGTAFGTVATDCTSAITTVLPIALPVLGAMIVIGIGIKVFKRITGK